MNKRLQTLVAGLALCAGLAAPWGVKAELRQWTGKNKTVVNAEFVDVSDDGRNVTLRTADGQIIRTQIANLTESDQIYIKHRQTLILAAQWKQAWVAFTTGNKYYWGEGKQQDFDIAASYYRKAASVGHTEALFSLGLMYDQGILVVTPRSDTIKEINQSRRMKIARRLKQSISPSSRRELQQELRRLYERERSKNRDGPTQAQRAANIKAQEYYRNAATRGHVGAMNNLAILLRGDGKKTEALFWYRKAAEANSPQALFNLGIYEQERTNNSLAADYFKRAGFAYMDREDREGALRCLDRLQKIGATALAQMLAGKIYHTPATSSDPPTEDRQAVSMGTGWFCSPTHIVTSWHILQGRESFYISSERFDKIPVRLLVSDRQNDLAVLELSEKSLENSRFLPLADRLVAAGEHVFTIGFPHITLLGKEPKYTDGTISALSGIGDDPRIFQISVPVQAGNSGGPLMNATGEVVGIVASKLAAARVFEWTGDFPQNVNFAVKIAYLRTLLDGRSVKYASGAGETAPATRSELVDRVKSAVVSIISE